MGLASPAANVTAFWGRDVSDGTAYLLTANGMPADEGLARLWRAVALAVRTVISEVSARAASDGLFVEVLMQLVLIRHGVAQDREAFAAAGQDDALRPLTRQGRWKALAERMTSAPLEPYSNDPERCSVCSATTGCPTLRWQRTWPTGRSTAPRQLQRGAEPFRP